MPAAPEAPRPESEHRRAAEFMQCARRHVWMRLRDASGWVQTQCPECGNPAVRKQVRTVIVVESPEGQEPGDRDCFE